MDEALSCGISIYQKLDQTKAQLRLCEILLTERGPGYRILKIAIFLAFLDPVFQYLRGQTLL